MGDRWGGSPGRGHRIADRVRQYVRRLAELADIDVTLTLREQDSKIRVISARTMSRKKRSYYDGQT
jgi:uncharacterized DUF497 family protein